MEDERTGSPPDASGKIVLILPVLLAIYVLSYGPASRFLLSAREPKDSKRMRFFFARYAPVIWTGRHGKPLESIHQLLRPLGHRPLVPPPAAPQPWSFDPQGLARHLPRPPSAKAQGHFPESGLVYSRNYGKYRFRDCPMPPLLPPL